MIASFDREEEQDFEELVLFLKEKGYRDCTGMASADNVLKYNDLKINSKYRTVRKQGEDIKLTNYEFDILYLSLIEKVNSSAEVNSTVRQKTLNYSNSFRDKTP